MKYRLNIKYPILEADVEKLAVNEKSISWAFRNSPSFKSSKLEDFNGWPESWVEEIEESAFEKWFSNNYDPDGIQDDLFKKWCKYSWGESQENRDLLYKEFIEKYEDFLHQDFELIDDCAANNKSIEILKSLEKIKKELNQ